MTERMNLNMEKLEMVTGGESDGQYTYYWDTVIVLAKMAGKTLEEVLSELHDCGQPQEMIDYVADHW